jgi:phage baseplate assembly protein W
LIKAVKQDLKEAGNYSISRYNLRCEANQVRILSQTDYSSDGEVTKDFTYDDPKWQDVVPDSVGEGILATVCHKKS